MKLLDPRRNQALKKMPLILGSGKRRSITKDFGMREVTEFQETSVSHWVSSFPHLPVTLFGGGTCPPPARPKVLPSGPGRTLLFLLLTLSFCGLLPQPPSLRPVREGSHTHTQPTAFSSTLPLPGFHSPGASHHPGIQAIVKTVKRKDSRIKPGEGRFANTGLPCPLPSSCRLAHFSAVHNLWTCQSFKIMLQ